MATTNSKLADVPKPTAGTTAGSVNMLCVLKSAGAVVQAPMVDMFYPVGSVYLTLNATNPSRLFGGTWEQIKGRFLLGAGDSYTAGATGGEATHTLSVNEMPSHAHNFDNYFLGYSKFEYRTGTDEYRTPMYNQSNPNDKTGEAIYTNSTGGGAAHNNMPPYLSVYMWKRTA